MMGEYGALTGGDIVTPVVEFLEAVINFMVTPMGMIVTGLAVIFLLFFARKR